MKSTHCDTIPRLTDEAQEIVPGVPYGRPEWVLSPAYWAMLVQRASFTSDLFSQPRSLEAEVCFCLLGGYGITAEINCAAYTRLEKAGLLDPDRIPTSAWIEHLLRRPLRLENRTARYRFPFQRAERLASALAYLRKTQPPSCESFALREYLLRIGGIGPKTASWIARNWLGCDQVAILDIHVERAGRKIGLFSTNDRLPRDYYSMEKKFLEFADALGVQASVLDIAIWSTMRNLGRIAYS